MAKIRDAIQFHNCLDNVLEYVSDRDSGRAMRNLCAYDSKGTLADSFWGHIYNIGGGESCRVDTYTMYQLMYKEVGIKNLDYVLDPKLTATRNFYGHYFNASILSLLLSYGMDFKTLSTVIGHESVDTTLDIYTHITDDMQRQAAVSIDRLFGGEGEPSKAEAPKAATAAEFTPYKGNRRKAGTGYVKQIGPNTWEGRYSPVWPDGKKHARNIYAKAEAECEEKLAALIVQMKAEIKAPKEAVKVAK